MVIVCDRGFRMPPHDSISSRLFTGTGFGVLDCEVLADDRFLRERSENVAGGVYPPLG